MGSFTDSQTQIDKSAITDIALNQTGGEEVSLLKRCEDGETGSKCKYILKSCSQMNHFVKRKVNV